MATNASVFQRDYRHCEPACMANPHRGVIFEGVSICPIEVESLRIRFRTVIRCDCRGIANIENPGIYRIFSNRGIPGETYLESFLEEVGRIRYVRVFPLNAEVVQDGNRNFIRVGDRHYEHFAYGCDFIIPTQRLNVYKYLAKNVEERL